MLWLFFLFFSDGVINCTSPQGETYGRERLLEFLNQNAQEDPDKLLHLLKEELYKFNEKKSFLF